MPEMCILIHILGQKLASWLIMIVYAGRFGKEKGDERIYTIMGHSKDINIGTNQYPSQEMMVIQVERHLQDNNKGR